MARSPLFLTRFPLGPVEISIHAPCAMCVLKQRGKTQFCILSVLSATRIVWSAAVSQAKSEIDGLVCANVFRLCWSEWITPDRMECAALCSHSVRQPWKTSSGFGFRERRVRPLCHLNVRQQTWQEIINFSAVTGLEMWESRKRFASLASARLHLQGRGRFPSCGWGGPQGGRRRVDMIFLSCGTFDFLVHTKSENFTRV